MALTGVIAGLALTPALTVTLSKCNPPLKKGVFHGSPRRVLKKSL
jgi:hypothetical protein